MMRTRTRTRTNTRTNTTRTSTTMMMAMTMTLIPLILSARRIRPYPPWVPVRRHFYHHRYHLHPYRIEAIRVTVATMISTAPSWRPMVWPTRATSPKVCVAFMTLPNHVKNQWPCYSSSNNFNNNNAIE